MALFWQLSGPESQLIHSWKKDHQGNAAISRRVFKELCHKFEDGTSGIELVFGIEPSGASQILISDSDFSMMRLDCRRGSAAYSRSRYSSLSPIRIDTDLRLQCLLEDRQKVSKATKSGKMKGDNSKANGRFWKVPTNTVRAAFEHGRCLYRILQNELHPGAYGLPGAPWKNSIKVLSLALNLWTPDGAGPTDALLDVGFMHTYQGSMHSQDTLLEETWYFRIQEQIGLQNSSEAENFDIPGEWHSEILPENKVGHRLQDLLLAPSVAGNGSPSPVILLVHDYTTVKSSLELVGVKTSDWKYGLEELLGFGVFPDLAYDPQRPSHLPSKFDVPGRLSSSRMRSLSPGRRPTPGLFSRQTHSPSPAPRYAPVYIVDTREMFNVATGSADRSHRVRPVTVFNALSRRNEPNGWCGGADASYIIRSWRMMVQGPTVDEQYAFHNHQERIEDVPSNPREYADSETAEDPGMFEKQENAYPDRFNDMTDSDGDPW